jgi:HKD family nuclease
MRVQLLNQPMSERDQWFGYILRSLLESTGDCEFSDFRFLVAFAKTSGLSRIAHSMDLFRQNGGHIEGIVGIDLKTTSRQALRMLLDLADEAYIYHDTSVNRTLHTKLYLLTNSKDRAIAFIGSANLTAGGLFTNYELMVQMDLDLTNSEDTMTYGGLTEVFSRYEDKTSGCIVRLTDEVITLLENEERCLLADEEKDTDESNLIAAEAATSKGQQHASETLFGTRKFPPAPQPDWLPQRGSVAVPAGTPTLAGFWKILSDFDVNPGSAPGQIIVPLRFANYFPEVTMTRGPDSGGRGRQWECSFAVLFDSPGSETTANDSRFIIYEPRTGHLRPNTEARFTFHNRVIFNQLSAGDMLVFQCQATQYWFRVTLASPGSPQYQSLRANSNRRFGELT